MADNIPRHPGVLLKHKFLDPLGISTRQLAVATDVPASYIDQLVAGSSPLTPDIALRLGLFFDVPAVWWLEMQARFDACNPERLADLRSVVKPFQGLENVLVTPSGVKKLDREPAAPTPSAPLSVAISEDFVERLRAQAALAERQLDREPEVVYFEDGTPCLTGR